MALTYDLPRRLNTRIDARRRYIVERCADPAHGVDRCGAAINARDR
jgi:hypothetical protein